MAFEVERALRYQKRAHSRRKSEIGNGSTLVVPLTRDAAPSNGTPQVEGSFSTPTTSNPRSLTHSHVFEYKARTSLSPIELHYIHFPIGNVPSSSFRDPSLMILPCPKNLASNIQFHLHNGIRRTEKMKLVFAAFPFPKYGWIWWKLLNVTIFRSL